LHEAVLGFTTTVTASKAIGNSMNCTSVFLQASISP